MGIKLRNYISDVETFFTEEEIEEMFLLSGYKFKKILKNKITHVNI